MSLQYIIDGYNLTNHRLFKTHARKKSKGCPQSLIDFITANHLCGSAKNTVTIVFDGYPPVEFQNKHQGNMQVIFSRDTSADEVISSLIDRKEMRKNAVVVSDDNEIRLFVRGCAAKSMRVEEFLAPLDSKKARADDDELKISYSSQLEITRELKKIWLK